jgi:hypothetical protein
MQPLTQFLTTGKHPATQKETSALLDAARSKLLTILPQTKMQTNKSESFLPTNMSMEAAVAIQERVSREKPGGKTPLLDALAKESLAQERRRDAKAQRPAAPARPSAAPAPAAPAMPTAAAIGSAIAREIVAIEDQRKAAATVRTRAQLDTMTPREITAFFKSGGKLTD